MNLNTCAWCGGPMRSRRHDALYCSASHRQLAYQLRRALSGAARIINRPAEIPGQTQLPYDETEGQP